MGRPIPKIGIADPCGSDKACVWRVGKSLNIEPSLLCVAMNSYGDPCGSKAVQLDDHTLPGLPLCRDHFKLHLEFLEDLLPPSAAAAGVENLKLRLRVKRDTERQRWEGNIYFARRGELVKIGYSTQPDRRIKTLVQHAGSDFDEVVIVPGTKDEERAYHDQFADHRQEGEWFSVTPQIESLMGELAAQPA